MLIRPAEYQASRCNQFYLGAFTLKTCKRCFLILIIVYVEEDVEGQIHMHIGI